MRVVSSKSLYEHKTYQRIGKGYGHEVDAHVEVILGDVTFAKDSGMYAERCSEQNLVIGHSD
jgi:hypothetical protein